MIVRQNIWPKNLSDFASMTFILTTVPLIYWFELWIVLPELYEVGTLPYLCHFIFGNFIMMNIVGNLTYTVLCDTSTRFLTLRATRERQRERQGQPDEGRVVADGWRFCGECKSAAPPRSWHCQTCNICILKRDHHCIFTGCCIGHNNHRYFLMFLFYLFVSTFYAFFYNNFFIWGTLELEFPMALLKTLFPIAIFVFGMDLSLHQFYLALYVITAVGMCFTGILTVYHFDLVLSGGVANERAKGVEKYNLGWRRNIVEVLGDRWYLALLLPYVDSKLSHDGTSWRTSCRRDTTKST